MQPAPTTASDFRMEELPPSEEEEEPVKLEPEDEEFFNPNQELEDQYHCEVDWRQVELELWD